LLYKANVKTPLLIGTYGQNRLVSACNASCYGTAIGSLMVLTRNPYADSSIQLIISRELKLRYQPNGLFPVIGLWFITMTTQFSLNVLSLPAVNLEGNLVNGDANISNTLSVNVEFFITMNDRFRLNSTQGCQSCVL